MATHRTSLCRRKVNDGRWVEREREHVRALGNKYKNIKSCFLHFRSRVVSMRRNADGISSVRMWWMRLTPWCTPPERCECFPPRRRAPRCRVLCCATGGHGTSHVVVRDVGVCATLNYIFPLLTKSRKQLLSWQDKRGVPRRRSRQKINARYIISICMPLLYKYKYSSCILLYILQVRRKQKPTRTRQLGYIAASTKPRRRILTKVAPKLDLLHASVFMKGGLIM